MAKNNNTKLSIALTLIAAFLFCWVFLWDTPPEEGIDKSHYNFERTPMQITVYTYSSQRELERTIGASRDSDLLGYAILYPEDRECEVHVLEDKEFLETLGHEIAHCLYGEWHPEI